MVTFRAKVYGHTNLWGNKSVKKEFSSGLYFHIRNSEDGEQIRFGILRSGKAEEALVELDPGESYTVLLSGILAVWASVENPMHSYVDCALLDGSSSQANTNR